MTPCKECGWEQALYDCATERTADSAYYRRWEEKVTTSKKGKVVKTKVLQSISCTRRDLLDRIKAKYKDMAYHRWVHYMTRHQEHLEIATFDGDTEILVKTDFAAAAKLQASHTTTCERPTTAYENVAMVLHTPQPLTRFGSPRQVTCDIWRTWSNANQNEEFHQVCTVLRAITKLHMQSFTKLHM
jgi:hypothetical protein